MPNYLNAADKGNGKVMRMIGKLYGEGLGITQDWTAALEWYHKAERAVNNKAFFLIGMRYYGGQGVTKDFTKAMVWFVKAAECI